MSDITYHFYTTHDDINDVIGVIKELQQDGPYKDFSLNEDQLAQYISFLAIDANDGKGFIVAAKDDDKFVGFMAACELQAHYMFSNNKVAQAIVWWVHKDYRSKDIGKNLQEIVDTWAKDRGLKYLIGGHYEDENASALKKMYKKNGYKLMEYSYLKEIK